MENQLIGKDLLRKTSLHKLFLLVSAIVVLHGTALLMFVDGSFQVGQLRYYTILSNFLVVIGFLLMALPNKKQCLLRSYLSFGILVHISITGLIYNFILVPFEGQPMVLSEYSNFVVHLLSMVLVWVNYLLFEEKGHFTYKHLWVALAPTLLYWLIFVLIGELIDFHPYIFMDPSSIGWPLTFFWLVILLIFFCGFMMTLLLLDKLQIRIAILPFLLAGTVSFGLVFAFGNTEYGPILHLPSIIIDNILEDDIYEFDFYVFDAQSYEIDFEITAQGVVTVFQITDENGEQIIQHVGEGLDFVEEHWLDQGAYTVSIIFLVSYADVVNFFEREAQAHLAPDEVAEIQELFEQNDINNAAFFSMKVSRVDDR